MILLALIFPVWPTCGPPAEADQRTTAVDSGPGFCDLVTNDMALELIVLHHKRKERGRAIGAALQHTSLNLDCFCFSSERFSLMYNATKLQHSNSCM